MQVSRCDNDDHGQMENQLPGVILAPHCGRLFKAGLFVQGGGGAESIDSGKPCEAPRFLHIKELFCARLANTSHKTCS